MFHLELKDAKYLFAYIAPIAAFAGIYFAGPWSLGAVYVAFVLIPLLEIVLPGTQKNLSNEEEMEKDEKRMEIKIRRLEEQIQLINQTKPSKEHLTKAINVSQAQCEARVEKVQSNLTNWKTSQVI